MNKRDLISELLGGAPSGIPAAFFMHFGQAYEKGQAAVERHLEFFRATDMDFVKIQFDAAFPLLPGIARPRDWATIPRYGDEYFAAQYEVVEGIVRAAGAEAMVIMTLYSPYMCAGHTVGAEAMTRHMAEDPHAVCRGMETIADSVLGFVRGCISRGVDGFYMSTQGGEAGQLPDPALFDTLVRPYDLLVMNEAQARCPFNILHICDYTAPYDDISRFTSYPGHVINTPLVVGGHRLAMADAARLFGRPVMGGMDRHGVLAHGTPAEVASAARAVLATAPARFILAANCTVPMELPWTTIRAAVDAAHEGRSA